MVCEELGVNVQYKLKSNITCMFLSLVSCRILFTLSWLAVGAETQAPIFEIEPAQVILSASDLAKSEELLAKKTGEIPQEQFDIMKQFIKDKVAQTEMNWVCSTSMLLSMVTNILLTRV
jgi:hypothetical protein